MASKKGALLHVNSELWTSPEAPREAASRAHFSNKKQEFEHKFQELLLELVLFVVFLKMLFQFVSISDFLKTSSKQNGTNVKST